MMTIGSKKFFFGARLIWALALLLIAVVLAGGPGVHLDLWSPFDGFMLVMKGGFLGGLALAVMALIVIIIIAVGKNHGGMGRAIFAFLIGLMLAAPVIYLRLSGGGVPPIHDITTDMVSPPEFIVLVGQRGHKPNSLDYGNGDPDQRIKLMTQQKEFYPDITPMLTSKAPEAAFAKALTVAASLDWTITGVDQQTRRFEATDYSFWFKFADDIVLTVKETPGGSRIDLRSISRVGISDLGVNAKRIKSFQEKYTQ